ncbi:MAG: UDP-N-acetylmuramoyl-L-alanyl-D-glutamate--2,6-diaminopimelate ligase [Phycisphaerales bacterium]|nr:UDP-N-acetylmuramoyl-L-alanyl-D-glutamate--2,6-diaminopimelate ligase [Phycisphaerales bacterium]
MEGMHPMLLHDLLQASGLAVDLSSLANIPITAIHEDSRQVVPGSLFIARPGTRADGAAFIASAIQRGAAAIITSQPIQSCPVAQAIVENPAAVISILANQFYGNPSRSMKVLGITGTNGKTTTAYLIRHLLQSAGRRCGMIGTVEIDDGVTCTPAEMTTPSAIDVARLLSQMRANGCNACVMETSSHALDQHRVDGITFAAGAFTNLTGDHLDYHHTMQQYADAKARLFTQLGRDAVAVVNADDEYAGHMIRHSSARRAQFSITHPGDYQATNIRASAQGSEFLLTTPHGQQQTSLRLIGQHNIENALCAAAIAGEALGLTLKQIAAGLGDATGAPGRLQVVQIGQPFAVLVDYAHTDDALENVLTALRPLASGQLRVLFGCGGDRDRTKRPRMARTATRLADVVYITSDNPRTEDPQAIIAEICAGLNPSSSALVEPDRQKAINQIIADAQPGDIVLLAGKGHENYQILGTTKHHFDDVEQATLALQKRSAAS